MKYYIHKIETDGRGRCVLELETASIENALSYIASFFETDGTYYIFGADGYTSQRYTLRRKGSDTTTRKTLDRWKVQIKRFDRWFTVYDGFNAETANEIYKRFKYWWIKTDGIHADDAKLIKKRVTRQPWHK